VFPITPPTLSCLSGVHQIIQGDMKEKMCLKQQKVKRKQTNKGKLNVKIIEIVAQKI